MHHLQNAVHWVSLLGNTYLLTNIHYRTRRLNEWICKHLPEA